MEATPTRPDKGERYPSIDANPCSVCRGITIAKLSSELGYPHHGCLAEVQEAMKGGCKLCALIHDAIARTRGLMTVRQPLGHQLAQLLAACTNVADGPHEINRIRLFWRKDIGFKQTTNLSERHYDKIVVSEQICITYGVAAIRQGPNAPPVVEQLKSSDSLGKLALYVDDGSDAAERYPGRRLPMNLQSPGDQAVLIRWLKKCAAESEEAYAGQGTTLPSRVIDVGDLDNRAVYLRSTARLPSSHQTDRYIILSHCWGGKVPADSTTTLATLQGRETAIDLEQLTQNFKDAIQLTRLFGVRYLWIDALCIVQDSSEDWQLESSRMGTYYKNSWLTLAAGMTGDSNGGLLGERTLLVEPFVELGADENSDGAALLFFSFEPVEPPDAHLIFGLRGRNNPYMWSDPTIKYEDAFQHVDAHDPKREHLRSLQTVLRTRGWVLQEELLSPRCVAFEPSQVYFRCDRFVEFESGRRVEPPNHDSCFLSKGRATFLSGSWFDLVEEYTAKELTYETDKLAAVSGLAREFAALRGSGSESNAPDEYYAGLWKSRLLEGLLWGRPTLPEPGEMASFKRTQSYVAPSWSWASVKGRVKFYFPPSPHALQVELLNVSAQASGSDPMGQLSDGHLVLRGRCFTALLPAEGLGTIGYGFVFNLDVKEHKPQWAFGVTILMITNEEGLLLELQGHFVLEEANDLQVAVYQRIGKFLGPPERRFDGLEYREDEIVVII